MKEQKLIEIISEIERNEHDPGQSTTLERLKLDLMSLRESKMKGQFIRSRADWLQAGEKATQYFCNLERKNCIDKTIRKICTENGEILTNQDNILKNIKDYYGNLFKSRDALIEDIDLNQTLDQNFVKKLSTTQAHSLEGKIQLEELNRALKNMKNNKTPGIDGFPSEFFKMFWSKLKFLILRVANYCYDKGKLSTTWRQCIINCIPKGDKPRQYLKNW